MLPLRVSLLAVVALSAALLGSRDAAAHPPAVLEAFPADGSVLAVPPDRVVVKFAKGISSKTTRIALVGPRGSSSLSIDGSGGKPVEELSIPVPAQGRGSYLVRWEITDTEGQRLGGRVGFVVRE